MTLIQAIFGSFITVTIWHYLTLWGGLTFASSPFIYVFLSAMFGYFMFYIFDYIFDLFS